MQSTPDWWPACGAGVAATAVRTGLAHVPADRRTAMADRLLAVGRAVGPVPVSAVAFAGAALGDPRLPVGAGGPLPGVEAVAGAAGDRERARFWTATLAAGVVECLPDGDGFLAAAAALRDGDAGPALDLLAAYRDDPAHRAELAALPGDGFAALAAGPLQETFGADTAGRATAPALALRDLLADAGFHRLVLATVAGQAGDPTAADRLAGQLPDQLRAVEAAGQGLTADLRERLGGPDGFERLSPVYFDEPPRRSPETFWRTGFTLRSVARGDPLARESAAERLLGRLRAGEHRLVVGRPGAGKSTLCKTVAWRWHRAGHGPVLYRAGGDGSLDDAGALVEAVDGLGGHVLVVVEDAVRPANAAVFEAVEAAGDRDGVSFLLDARRPELEGLDERYPRLSEGVVNRVRRLRGDRLGTFDVPAVDRETCRALVERFETLTGSAPVESADALFDRVATAGVGDEMLHLAYELVGSADGTQSGLERTVAEAFRRHRAADGLPEVAGDVTLAVNVLNAANVPVHRELLSVLGDDDALETTLDALDGDLVFDRGGVLGTPHEVWSALYLRQLVETAEEPEARRRFERVVNALFDLADPEGRPARPGAPGREPVAGGAGRDGDAADGGDGNGAIGGVGTGEDAADDPERLVGREGASERSAALAAVRPAAKLVEQVADLGTRWPVLAPLYGTADTSELSLPAQCSTITRVRFVAARGDMYRDSGSLDVALAEYRHADGLLTADDATDRRMVRKHRVRHHNRVGDVHRRRGRLDDAEGHFERALTTARELRFRTGEARSLTNLGVVARMRGRLGDAEERYEAALSIYRDVGSRHDGARMLKHLGNISWKTGDYDGAEANYEEALAAYRDAGDRKGQAEVLNNLGVLANRTGDFDAAEAYHRRSMRLKREVGDRVGAAKSRNNLGLVYQKRGDYDAAEAHFEAGLELKRDVGDRLGQAKGLMNLGVNAEKRGDLDAAGSYHRRSLALYRDVGHRNGVAGCLNNLGAVARQSGRLDEAERYFERGLAAFEAVDDRHGQAECLEALGRAAADRGDPETALERFERAADLFVETGSAQAVEVLERTVELARDCGHEETAAGWCETALAFTEEAGLEEAHRKFRERCHGTD